MTSVADLEKAFHVYLDEIERCRQAGTYRALLHVLVSLPDICAALEDTGWVTGEKYVEWCRRYCPCTDVVTAEVYREIRDIVLRPGSHADDGRALIQVARIRGNCRPNAFIESRIIQ